MKRIFVKEFLCHFNCTFLLTEIIWIYLPILKLHVQSLLILFQKLIELAMIPNELNDHFEYARISVNEDPSIKYLEGVTPWKSSFQSTAFYHSQRRFVNIDILVTSNIQLDDIWYFHDFWNPVFLFLPLSNLSLHFLKRIH